MTQLKELLEKEELDHLKEVKEDIKEENQALSNEKEESTEETAGKKISENGSKMWVWLAAIVVAVVILK